MSDEEVAERDWDYMARVASWVYEALHRIPRTREAMGALFDMPVTRWEGDDEVDLTNKALFGLIQLEIEGIQESLEGLAPRTGWRLLFRQKDAILYQSAAGEVVKVLLEIAENIVRGVPFEGEVTAHGRLLRFSVGSEVLAEIPRSLVLALRESRPGEGSGRGVLAGEVARRNLRGATDDDRPVDRTGKLDPVVRAAGRQFVPGLPAAISREWPLSHFP